MARSFLNDGEHYDACHAYLTADLPFWTSLVTPGLRVLELGCGTGRVAIPMAAAGAVVTGLDASAELLARARSKSAAVTWVQGDMRERVAGEFDLVIIAFNTLLVLVERADIHACLTSAHAALAPGGKLVMDTMLTPAERIAATPHDEHISSYRLPDGTPVRVTGRRTFDMSRQLRRLELTIHTGDVVEHDVLETHVAFPWELELLVERAGFSIETVYGDYNRGPLTATSKSCIIVACA